MLAVVLRILISYHNNFDRQSGKKFDWILIPLYTQISWDQLQI